MYKMPFEMYDSSEKITLRLVDTQLVILWIRIIILAQYVNVYCLVFKIFLI